MAALPTICLSALRALIPGGSCDASSSSAAPSSLSTSAQPSSGAGAVSSTGTSIATVSSTSRSADEHLHWKEADEKSREVWVFPYPDEQIEFKSQENA